MFRRSFFLITERDVRSLERIYNLNLKSGENRFEIYVSEINDSFAQLTICFLSNQIDKSVINRLPNDLFDVLDGYNDITYSLDFLNNKINLKLANI